MPPQLVVGRDATIKDLWQVLDQQSVVLVAERRIGKTCVLRKMEATPPTGWVPIYMPIEGVRTPKEFVSRIVDQTRGLTATPQRLFVRLHEFYSKVAGKDVLDWSIPELDKHWKTLLEVVLRDLRENFENRIVFLWDEFPQMIANIKEDMEPRAAMELLDVLRDHRLTDTKGRVRMLYTGSIGLHLVVGELKDAGYRNDPTNDMYTISLGPLAPVDGQALARRDLAGLRDDGSIVLKDSIDDIAAAVARAVDYIPFYISHLVVRLIGQKPVEVAHVEVALDELIGGPDDKAHFGHYAERIEVYYRFRKHSADAALSVLNIIAKSAVPVSEDEVWAQLESARVLESRGAFQSLMDMLVKDHYLVVQQKNGRRHYDFSYQVIKRWWRARRA